MTIPEETAVVTPPMTEDVVFSSHLEELCDFIPAELPKEQRMNMSSRATFPWSFEYDQPLELRRLRDDCPSERMLVRRVDLIAGDGGLVLFFVTAQALIPDPVSRLFCDKVLTSRFIVSMFNRQGGAQPPCAVGDAVTFVGARELSHRPGNHLYLADGIRVHTEDVAREVSERIAAVSNADAETSNTDELPADEAWRALHLPDDPPDLEQTVDRVLELLLSAQLLNIDWDNNSGCPYNKAREIWLHDAPSIQRILRAGGIPFPCYPVEMYYQSALYSFLDTRSRHFSFEDDYTEIRDEIRHGLRWTRNTVTFSEMEN